MSYVDFQTNIVQLAKQIARTAQEMVSGWLPGAGCYPRRIACTTGRGPVSMNRGTGPYNMTRGTNPGCGPASMNPRAGPNVITLGGTHGHVSEQSSRALPQNTTNNGWCLYWLSFSSCEVCLVELL